MIGKKIQLSESEIRGDLEVFRGLCGLKEPREREREREEENSRGFHINSAALNKERNLNTTSGRGRGAGRGRKSAFSSRQRVNDDDYRGKYFTENEILMSQKQMEEVMQMRVKAQDFMRAVHEP